MRKVHYILAKVDASGNYKVFKSGGVADADAQILLDNIKPEALKSITPFIKVADTKNGVLIMGPKASDIIAIAVRSNLGSQNKVSIYLLHRLAQGLLFMRSQMPEDLIEGYIQVCKLDQVTGRFDKKTYDSFFAMKGFSGAGSVWSQLSAYLKQLDEDYLNGEPMFDMVLRTVARFSPDYKPKMDPTLNFDMDMGSIKGDIVLAGAIEIQDKSLVTVLLDRSETYSRSVVDAGYISDSKAKTSLLNFIENDPFLKAAYATSKTSLDGQGIKQEKIDNPEEVVKDAMIQIDKDKNKDVFNSNANWLEWFLLRTAPQDK